MTPPFSRSSPKSSGHGKSFVLCLMRFKPLLRYVLLEAHGQRHYTEPRNEPAANLCSAQKARKVQKAEKTRLVERIYFGIKYKRFDLWHVQRASPLWRGSKVAEIGQELLGHATFKPGIPAFQDRNPMRQGTG
jgi:hypothetical protein